MSEEPTAESQPVPDGWGQPITEERQSELEALAEQQRLWAEQPKEEPGESHFKGVRLTGADIFWLAARALAGPEGDLIASANQLRHISQGWRVSVSNLHLEEADLGRAHLEGASLHGAHLEGVHLREAHLEGATFEDAHLDGAYLSAAHLDGTIFYRAHLERAYLGETHLERLLLREAHLETAYLREAHLEGADLREAHLERARISGAHLEGANLDEAHLEGAELISAFLKGTRLGDAHLEGANLDEAHLEGAHLGTAHLEGASLHGAHLQGAYLYGVHLEGANASQAYLQGANLSRAHLGGKTYTPNDPDFLRVQHWIENFPQTLAPIDLRGTFLDDATDLSDAMLAFANEPHWKSVGPYLADVHWASANLIRVDWGPVVVLADEYEAGQVRNGTFLAPRKKPSARVADYRAAGRAYRLLSVALRSQGLSTDATRFHYRAELMDRKAHFHRRALGRWLFSWLLGTFAGYGDRLGRLFATYATVELSFALAMLVAAVQVPANQPLSLAMLQDVLVLSVTSFHGRGIQPPGLRLDDVLATLAGAEAVFGLLIEGLFIAAFTRRVTGG